MNFKQSLKSLLLKNITKVIIEVILPTTIPRIIQCNQDNEKFKLIKLIKFIIKLQLIIEINSRII